MLQERLKHHGWPNGGLSTGVRDEVPGEAEERSVESARADILSRQDDAGCGRSSRCAFHRSARLGLRRVAIPPDSHTVGAE
jgi:hypothetical protein